MKSQMFGKFYQRKKERKEVFLIKTLKQNLQASETVMLSHIINNIFYLLSTNTPRNHGIMITILRR